MERLGIRRNPAVLLIVGVLVLCLALPGAAMAATKNVTLYAGSSTQATKVLKAKGLKAAEAKWTTSKKSVVTVKNGKITAKKAGKSTITAKLGKKTFKFAITVKKVALSKKSLTLEAGKTSAIQLKGDKIKSVKSSKTSVVTVKKVGTKVKITAKAAGSAKVTVVSKKGTKFTCKVKVTASKSNVPFNEAILGVETNSVVLAWNAIQGPDEYMVHLKVKDSAIGYATWSKSFKLKLADGYQCTALEQAGEDSYDGHTITYGKFDLSGNGKTETYYVEAYDAELYNRFF